MLNSDLQSYEIVILGAGFAGLGMGAQLKMREFENFIILERGARIGGVWREEAYPDAACDTELSTVLLQIHPHSRVS
jgi:cation diffusion facilitator CzcD-associated flavoprotein CzcO